MGGARVGRRGKVLTRERASQDGQWRRTPLHIAAMQGKCIVLCNPWGRFAFKGDYLEVARVLLEAGADITAKDGVSERRMGGEGQRISESRDCGGS